jgi:predicted lysophospholipase L1 biosynthesis ABC-type transport system permease subunit
MGCLALTAYERRRAVALLRSLGASRIQVAAVFTSTAGLIALLAAPLGVAVERYAIGPEVARAAASYVTVSLGAGSDVITLTLAGLAVGTLLVAALVGRAATAQPVVSGLRED